MKECNQNSFQTIYDHGVSVSETLSKLINYIKYNIPLENKWIIPKWLEENKEKIKNKLMDDDILLEYALFHDCGKPFCIEKDIDGKTHFPNHAKISEKIWIENGGNELIGKLISMDMDIHLLKDSGIEEFCKRKESISLLITGLAEIHANSEMFGGYNALSFKIKFKNIERRGNAILKILK